MNASRNAAGRGWRGLTVVYAACLLCLWGVAGGGWRVWRFERRGTERPRETVPERRPGINVALEQYDPVALERVLDDLQALGFTWLRQRFPWQAIEPQDGAYEWAPWDVLVREARRRGFGLIAVLDDPPEWAQRHDRYPLPCLSPCDADTYARFASVFARRYGDAIDHYQVWDEPNLSRSWGNGHVAPCGYAVLLDAAYEAIHAADPSAQVLGGGLAPTQAPGPADLNDLVYLRELYAHGGGSHFDILAVKPYGFWSGPWDRRVAPDVLNFSRVVAVRELMRAVGDGDKPVWAVEWGWHVTPVERARTASPPWGTDTAATQRPRIAGAVSRVRTEWPWMGVMCWAEYQPGRPEADPRWGFALRGPDGAATLLYDILRVAIRSESSALRPRTGDRWSTLAVLLGLAVVNGAVLWPRLRFSRKLGQAWRWWVGRRPVEHLMGLLVLVAAYALVPWPEWILVVLALGAAVCYLHPHWTLLGAVWSVPLYYAAKPIGALRVSPSEVLLFLLWVVTLLRWVRRRQWPVVPAGLGALDLVWGGWVLWGALSPLIAPDRSLAVWEWRLCLLGPALLYAAIRLGGANRTTETVTTNGAVWLGGNAPIAARCCTAAVALWGADATPRLRSHRDGVHLALAARTSVPGERCAEAVTTDWEELGSDTSSLVLAWLLSGAFVALAGIAQWMTGMLVPAGSVGRVTGVFYSPNHLALYLERVWPLTLALAVHAGVKGWRRRWAWLGIPVVGMALYLTYSRGAWLLAVPAALAAVVWCYRRHLRWWMVGLGVALLLVVTSNVFLGRSVPQSSLLDEVRIPVWESTLEMIADHPWLGVGLAGFRFRYQPYMRVEAWTEPLLYHPHNAWLDAAVRLGLPGLLLFVVLVALCVCRAVRWTRGTSRLERAVAVGCLASLLAGLAHGLVDSGYFLPDLAWSLALVAGIVTSKPGHRVET